MLSKTGGWNQSLTTQSKFHNHEVFLAQLSKFETAVVHEWWARFGGSEKVAFEIHQAIPSSELWAMYIDKENEPSLKISESWFSRIPKHESRIFSAAMAPLIYRTLSKKKFDLVISSSHTFAHTVKLSKSIDARYLSYIHTPSRAIWSPTIDDRSPISNELALRMLRKLDRQLGAHVVSYAANSTEVANRIRNFWNRDSHVIHPPVNIYTGSLTNLPGENLPFPERQYLISAGRFVAYKNHDFSIRLAAKARLPIVVMGSGELRKSLMQLAQDLGVEAHFEIAPNQDRWRYLIANALCFLFPVHEDFGMTPVESLSLGTPVIAFAKGGALDFMNHGVNGLLIPELKVELFLEAVMSISGLEISSIRKSAKVFSKDVFLQKLYHWISYVL